MEVDALGATTLMSKLTRRSPDIPALLAPMPCEVWQAEQEKPSLMWRACSVKVEFETI